MFSPRVVTKASCSRASSSSVIRPSCSSISASGKQLLQRQRRLFSVTIQRQASNTYYVATLPWADKDQDRKERFNELIKNSRFTDNENIVASSITTAKRASPIASSLKAEIERLNTTADKTGGGAWLLLKATTEDEAKNILNETNAGQVFDLDKSTLQIVELDQGATEGEGPLYAGSSNDDSSSSSSGHDSAFSSSSAVTSNVEESSDDNADPLTSGNLFSQQGSAESAGGKPKESTSSSSASKTSQKKDKTNRKPRETAAETEESRTGGSSIETSGPLYGK